MPKSPASKSLGKKPLKQSPAPSLSVPVFIDEPTGVDRLNESIMGGIPIPRGQLRQGGRFVLKSKAGPAVSKSAKNTEQEFEGTPCAYWPDGSVKWLHLCGQVDLKGGKTNAFHLVSAGSRASAAKLPNAGLKVSSRDGALAVRGGLIEVHVAGDARQVLTARYSGPSAKKALDLLNGPGLSAELTLTDGDGQDRRACPWTPTHLPQAVVQSAKRVVVRLGGEFRDPFGRLVGELILFIEVLKDSPELHIEPVFIYLGSPDRDLVAGLTLKAHSTFGGDDTAYGFANEQGRGYWDVIQRIRQWEGSAGPRWPMARQVQLGSSFYRTEKRTFAQSSWVKAVEGQRSQGWCHLANSRGGLTAAMRYYWQEYPHSLSIDADSGEMTFGLVAPEAAPLDLRRYSPVIYGRAVYEASSGEFPAETHGATGIAKAHELMLRFHAPGEADVAERGLFFSAPCRIMPEPDYFVAAGVVGQLARPKTVAAARGGKEFRRLETLMDRLTQFLVDEREVRGWYGLMNYGDVMIAYYADRDMWAFDDGGYAWLNTESLPDYGLWLSSLRRGRSDWLEAAIAMTRHNRDVDTHHRGIFKGCGTRHNVNHWGCQDKEWRVTMPLVRRLHYYMTADPWTAEVIAQTVELYQSFTRTQHTAPSMTGALAGIMVKYEMDHDATSRRKTLATLTNFADLMARAFRPDGQLTATVTVDLDSGLGEPYGDGVMTWKSFFLNSFGGQHTLVELTELLNHQALSQAIIRHMEFYLSGPASKDGVVFIPGPPAEEEPKRAKTMKPGARLPDRKFELWNVAIFLAHAYRATGLDRYRQAMLRSLTNKDVKLREVGGDTSLPKDGPTAMQEPRHATLCEFNRVNKIACHLGILLHTIPYGLAVLDKG